MEKAGVAEVQLHWQIPFRVRRTRRYESFIFLPLYSAFVIHFCLETKKMLDIHDMEETLQNSLLRNSFRFLLLFFVTVCDDRKRKPICISRFPLIYIQTIFDSFIHDALIIPRIFGFETKFNCLSISKPKIRILRKTGFLSSDGSVWIEALQFWNLDGLGIPKMQDTS